MKRDSHRRRKTPLSPIRFDGFRSAFAYLAKVSFAVCIILFMTGSVLAQETQNQKDTLKESKDSKDSKEEVQNKTKEPNSKESQVKQDGTQEDSAWLNGFKVYGLIRFRPEVKNNFNFDSLDKSTLSDGAVCTVKRQAGKTCAASGGTESTSKFTPTTTKDDNKEFVGQKIQLGFEKRFTQDVTGVILLQDARVWGGQDGSSNGLGTANSKTDESTDVREAYINVKDVGPLDLRVGRQIFKYGDERLVGGLDWTNVGRSFDGVRLMRNGSFWSAHLWGTVIAEDKTDFNAITDGNESTPALDDAYFAGFYNTFKFTDVFQVEPYYLGVYKKWTPKTAPLVTYANGQPILLTDQYGISIASKDRLTDRDNLHTLGARLTNRTKNNKSTIPLDWTLEFANQTGDTGERKTPEDLDLLLEGNEYTIHDQDGNTIYELNHDGQGYYADQLKLHETIRKKVKYQSYAFAANLGYTFKEFVRIGGEYAQASGDKNPNDLKKGTFQNLFHTNHIHYGQADQVSWQNMKGVSLNISFDFQTWGKLGIAIWDVDKLVSEDSWYGVTGAKSGVATTEFPVDYAEPTGSAKQSVEKRFAKRHLKREIWQKFYNDDLFNELDLTYDIKYKSLAWQAGYSYIVAGNSVGVVKDDFVYAFASKYLDQILYSESLETSMSTLINGKVVSPPPRFKPKAHFAYLMMTLKF